MPRTAVVIATFDQARWLRLALRAWARQSIRPDLLVVADDGSGPETAEVVREASAEHVRQERIADQFGKCRAVNAAVRRARELGAEWLFFTDGDCLPARDLLARHLAVTRPGRYAAGGVVRFSKAVSFQLDDSTVDSFQFERLPGDKRRYALPRSVGRAVDALLTRRTPFKGGNSSCWLADFVRVNGYDERFGWGVEDKELGERLQHAGVRGFSLRYSAPVFHLWHERPYVRDDIVARNRHILAQTRATRASATPSGIDTKTGERSSLGSLPRGS